MHENLLLFCLFSSLLFHLILFLLQIADSAEFITSYSENERTHTHTDFKLRALERTV